MTYQEILYSFLLSHRLWEFDAARDLARDTSLDLALLSWTCPESELSL